jgi:Protein of unknown function (DUF3999)
MHGKRSIMASSTRSRPPSNRDNRIVIGGARAAADPQRLGGDAVTRDRIDWKRLTLWASLVLGVAILGWMALRLGRQMSRTA